MTAAVALGCCALSITDPAAMTDSQMIEAWTFHAASMRPAVSPFWAYKQNALSRTDYLEETYYLEEIDAPADYITTPFARAWWKHTRDFFPLELTKDVDVAMSSANEPDMLVLQLDAIRRDLAK